MTLVASWVSVDDKPTGKVPAAIYIGSDSQYTWPDGRNYGLGQKTFCCFNSPEIFGFCGDVLFPLNTINQLVSLIDSSCLFTPDESAETKNEIVFQFVNDALKNYPLHNITFSIIYGTRVNGCFSVMRIKTSPDHCLISEKISIPPQSSIIISDGSGNADFRDRWREVDVPNNENYRTARNVVYCFTDSIKNGKDSNTGGLPQIVGLYRGGNGKMFGFVDDGKRYLYGRETEYLHPLNLQALEWRNNKFERINPHDMDLIINASKHYFR